VIRLVFGDAVDRSLQTGGAVARAAWAV